MGNRAIIAMEPMTSTPLTFPTRPLWEALAQRLALAKPGQADLETLHRLYRDLRAGDKLRCRAEIHAIRRARRGELHAVIP